MYICTECDEKFKTKPKYCSCGNDEFKFVAEAEEQVHSVPNKQNNVSVEPQKVESKISEYKQILSYLIFVSCLIIAVLVWFINPKTELKEADVKKEVPVTSIPDIDSIWNDTPKKVQKENIVNEEQSKPLINTVQEQLKKITKSQDNKSVSQSKTTKKTQAKTVSKPKKVKNVSQNTQNKNTQKPVASNSQKPTSQKDVQDVKKQDVKLPQSIIDTVKAPVPEQKQETIVEKPIVVEPKPVPKMSDAEFLNYKGAIRSALLAKLNVVAIKGSGDCAIEFSLDNSGKLINRTFIYKSANKTVNDEVYNMLMRLPYYNQPPAHYNGEKIKLKFVFNNGYYEITFI